MTSRALALAAPAAALVLASCGGGGSDSAPPQQLQLNTTAINVGAPADTGPPGSVQLSGTVSGKPRAVFATVLYTNVGIAGVTAPQVSGPSATAWVDFRPALTLQPGIYRDTITVRACPDASCTTQFAGSPATVNVTYVVGLVAAPAGIAVQVVEGAAPASRTIDLTYYAGTGNWTTDVAYGTGDGWLTVPASGAALPATLTVAFATRPAGNHAATLGITANAPGATSQTRTIPITYVVQALLQAAAVQELPVTNQQSATGQTRTSAVTSADAARPTAWSATVDASSAWLQLTSASGTTGGNNDSLQLALAAAEVAKLRNGRYVATVSLDPEVAGASTITLPVVLNVDRSQVATVAPYVAAANRSGEVILRGTRLDEGAIQAIRFGAVDATTFQLEGPTRIRAIHPPLAPGRYPVTAIVGGTALDTSAELVVQAASSYVAAGTAASPVPFAHLTEFDAERRACYLASGTLLGAVRAGTTSWSTQLSPAAFSNIHALALTADGRELLVADRDDIVHLDPATLEERRRTRIGPTRSNSLSFTSLARVDDGSVALAKDGDIWLYRPWTGTQLRLTSIGQAQLLEANRTGNRIVWRSDIYDYRFNAVDSAAGPSTLLYSGTFALPHTFASDRFGTRWAFSRLSSSDDSVVTDGAGAVIGLVPASSVRTSVLSEDGRTLALAMFDGGEIFRFYDVSPLSGGGAPVVLGSASRTFAGEDRLWFAPHQDEIVSCGQQVTAVAVP